MTWAKFVTQRICTVTYAAVVSSNVNNTATQWHGNMCNVTNLHVCFVFPGYSQSDESGDGAQDESAGGE